MFLSGMLEYLNGVAPGVAPTNLGGLQSLDQVLSSAIIPGAKNNILLQFIPETNRLYFLLGSIEISRNITGTVMLADGGVSIRGLSQVAGRIELYHDTIVIECIWV